MLPLILLASCAPLVDPVTMSAVVQNESGGNSLAIHDNATGKSYSPKSMDEAVGLAKRLINAGHSVDLGLAQINSRNLKWVGMTVEQVFEPCSNLQASQQVLVDAHQRSGGDLQKTLQIYNTGKAAGSQYAAKVYGKAGIVVPTIPGGKLTSWTKGSTGDAPIEVRVQPSPAASPFEIDGSGLTVAW